MHHPHRLPLALALVLGAFTARADPPATPLVPLGNAAALRAAIAPILRIQQRAVARERALERASRSLGRSRGAGTSALGSMPRVGSAAGYGRTGSSDAPAPRAAAAATPTPSSPRVAAAPHSITNNQELGVDEGDIVKAHDQHLIVLRRGRLFSVHLGAPQEGARALTPRTMINAYGPGGAPADWYDELLLDGDTLVVTGYSYDRGQTEIGRFRIDANGVITWRDTLFIRTGDYFSSRNYASRLVGHQLVVYLPIPMIRQTDHDDFVPQSLPSVRLGHQGPWRPVTDYRRVYGNTLGFGSEPILHTVLRCDLDRPTPHCRAEGVLGPSARSYYVSRNALYLWVSGNAQWEDWTGNAHRDARPGAVGSVLYRFPLGGGALTAVRTRGAPVDQFSFREHDGALQVLVRAEASGDGMWASDVSQGAVGLVTVPAARFSQTVTALAPTSYRALPTPTETGAFHNRFVGDAMLYGMGSSWSRAAAPQTYTLFVHDLARDTTHRLPLPHAIDRIEPLARDALVVGPAGTALHFSTLALDATPTVVDRLERPAAAQSETRSHGFFYLPTGERQGMLGLPLTRGGRAGWRQLRETGAEVTFLRVDGLRLRALGSLRAEGGPSQRNDACVASCADWYGNARPIFWNDRVLALLGYELLEGTLDGDTLTERAHVDFFTALQPPAR